MADDRGESFSIPWTTLVGLMALAGGAYLALTPVASSRPYVEPLPQVGTIPATAVDARLWQDPIAAARNHYKRAMDAKGGAATENTRSTRNVSNATGTTSPLETPSSLNWLG